MLKAELRDSNPSNIVFPDTHFLFVGHFWWKSQTSQLYYFTLCNRHGICDTITFSAFSVAILLISQFCCFNNLSMKNQFFQNTKSKNQNFVFPPKPSESTLLCRHFAPLIVRIGSRSSEKGPFEVWKFRHAWILRFSSFFLWFLGGSVARGGVSVGPRGCGGGSVAPGPRARVRSILLCCAYKM